MVIDLRALKQEKAEMRALFRQKRREMDVEEKNWRDSAIVHAAENLASFRYAEYVLLYAAKEDEINIDALARTALAKGKKIAFPRCNTENYTMQFHFVQKLDDLRIDSYGIREPSPSLPVFDPSVHTGSAVCFVPGLVFDKYGYRIGYGKGYYDRFLSAFSGSRIGVVYSDFTVDSVPRGRFDTKVNILLSEKNVRVPYEN